MLSVSFVVAKGIYGLKMELGTTEDRLRGRRRHSNTAAKLVALIVRDREQIWGKGSSTAAFYLLPRYLLLASMTD